MRRRLLAFVGGGLVWPGRSVAARPGGVGQWRREPHHPAVDGDVVDLDAARGHAGRGENRSAACRAVAKRIRPDGTKACNGTVGADALLSD
jgi:hypothetical protein